MSPRIGVRAPASDAPGSVSVPVWTSFLDTPAPVFLLPATEAMRTQENQVGAHVAAPPEALLAGSWNTLEDGRSIWRLKLRSEGARTLRVHVQAADLVPGTMLVTAAGSAGDLPFQPGPPGHWTGSLPGDSALIEYQPEDPEDRSLPFEIDRISHGLVDVHQLEPAKDPADRAVTCAADAVCNTAYAASMDAIALLRVEAGGGSYVCSGFLVATRAGRFDPYLLTSNQCVPNQSAASTVEAFFRYRTPACNRTTPALPARHSLGATYLAGQPADALDFALLRLPTAPSGAFFLGWDPNKPAVGSTLTALGHPQGTFLQSAQGQVISDAGSKFAYRPLAGVADVAMSGAPWLRAPGIVAGLQARGSSGSFATACAAAVDGELVGGGEWFSSIYPLIASSLEDLGPCIVSVTPPQASFPAQGGFGSFAVTTSSSVCPRNVVNQAGFVSITANMAGTGATTIPFSVSANTSTAERSGTVNVGGRNIVIRQAGATPCDPAGIVSGIPVLANIDGGSCFSQLRPGRRSRRYQFSGNAGQTVTVDLSSTQFDTFLYLVDPSGAVVASNDDTVGSDARIPGPAGTFRLPATGIYLIEATTYAANQGGPFRLSLTLSTPCQLITVGIGSEVRGTLSAADCLSPGGGDFYADRFLLAATAGQRVRITAASPTLDMFLRLYGPRGDRLAEDDDSAGSLNARIPASGTLLLPESGTYTIEATTYNELATGAYSLTIDAGPAALPPSSGVGGVFRAVTPCRLLDTRSGATLAAGAVRDVPIPQSSCGIPANAKAYSLNLTAVPSGILAFLTVWPTGGVRPAVSTLNAFEGAVIANAAIVPAGSGGAVSVYVTNAAHVVVDINGYFE